MRDYVRGKPKWLARSPAATLGAVTPFCSCSSVPLAILFGILGWKLTLMYVAAGLTVAYIGGMIMDRFKLERWGFNLFSL